MFGFVRAQLRYRYGRAIALVGALLVAVTSFAVLTGTALSFLGAGARPPTPEWGLMINEGSSYIVSGQWWVTFFPGLAILSVVLGFFMLDHGLKKHLRRGN